MSTSTDDDVVDIAANIGHVRQMMDDAIASCERESGSVRLVAVSKTKPLELLQAASIAPGLWSLPKPPQSHPKLR